MYGTQIVIDGSTSLLRRRISTRILQWLADHARGDHELTKNNSAAATEPMADVPFDAFADKVSLTQKGIVHAD